MKRYISVIIAAAAVALTALSCAKEGSSEANEAQKLYLESWMQINHPGIDPTGLGIYILEDTPGTGSQWTENDYFVFVNCSVRKLDGTVIQTNDVKLSRQLGTYDKTASYEPVVWTIGENYCYAGVEEMLNGMKVGGTRTAVIPNWLLTASRYDSADDYLSKTVDSSPVIYTITLKGFTQDLKKYRTDELDTYVHENIGSSLDSTYYNNTDGSRLGFYFKSLQQPSDSIIPSGSTGYLWYVARRLDGQVVDTNIADTAKVHNIYNASGSYTPVSITFAEDYTEIQLDGSSCITGFQAALFRMHAYEKAYTAFYYGLGYGGTSKTLIPSYSSLQFELELVDKQ